MWAVQGGARRKEGCALLYLPPIDNGQATEDIKGGQTLLHFIVTEWRSPEEDKETRHQEDSMACLGPSKAVS